MDGAIQLHKGTFAQGNERVWVLEARELMFPIPLTRRPAIWYALSSGRLFRVLTGTPEAAACHPRYTVEGGIALNTSIKYGPLYDRSISPNITSQGIQLS